jgi:hypothetical protein
MDDLARFIFRRVKCCFHPYIPPNAGWRTYPQHVTSLLRHLEPLHIIAVGSDWVGVDGVFANDERPHRVKYDVAVETLEKIFGSCEERAGSGNLMVCWLNTGIVCFSLFWGSVWYLAVCVELEPYPLRFAYVSDPYRFHAPIERGGEILCVAAVDEKAETGFRVSRKFFLDPRPENVRLFGDLLFLAQSEKNWSVGRSIDIDFTGDFERVTRVLKGCVGFESFMSHAYKELILQDLNGAEGWRGILRVLRGADSHSAVEAGGLYLRP